jgi:alpha-tubulin suppressor-like RCC1 family protein
VSLQHACAIRGGKAYCWGRNNFGQLGDGSGAAYRTTPVEVAGLGETAMAISAGGWHSCALVKGVASASANQAAFCWGGNNLGQLGNGTNSDSATAVPVQGLSSNVTSISAGLGFSCAVVNGAAFCWGVNASGELGNGSTTSSNVPVAVQGLDGDVTVISAGGEHVCALQRGVAYCWGRNSDGRLGDGTTNDSALPVQVQGLTSVSQIVAGEVGTCAIVNGAAWCWGSNM